MIILFFLIPAYNLTSDSTWIIKRSDSLKYEKEIKLAFSVPQQK